jgi:hypothetical protein
MKHFSVIICLVICFLAGYLIIKDNRPEYTPEQKKQYKIMYQNLLKEKLKVDQKDFMRKVIKNYYELTPKRQNLIFVALKKNKNDMAKLDELMTTLQKTLLVDNYNLNEQEQQDLGYFTQNNVIEYLHALQAPVLYR